MSEILFLFDKVFGHEAMAFLDASLNIVSGRAEVLKIGLAGQAVFVLAGSPDRGNDKITNLQVAHIGANFDDLAHGFMTKDKVFGSGGWIPIDKSAYFAIGPADAHIDCSDPDLVILMECRRWMFNNSNRLLARGNGYCFHADVLRVGQPGYGRRNDSSQDGSFLQGETVL